MHSLIQSVTKPKATIHKSVSEATAEIQLGPWRTLLVLLIKPVET